MFDYFYNCIRKACLYFSLPTSHQNISQYYESKRNTSHQAKENENKIRQQSAENDLNSVQQTGAESQAHTTLNKQKNIGTIQTNETELASKCDSKEHKDIVDLDSGLNNEETDSDSSIKENLFLEECKQNKFESSVELEQEETEIDKGGDELVPSLNKLSITDKESSEDNSNSCNVCDLVKSDIVIVKTCKHDIKPSCDIECEIEGATDTVEHADDCLKCETDDHESLDKSREDSQTDNVQLKKLERSNVEGYELDERTLKSSEVNQSDGNCLQNVNNLATDIVDSLIDSVIDGSSIKSNRKTNESEKAETEADVTVQSGIKERDKKVTSGEQDESDTCSDSSDDDMEESESTDSSPLANKRKRVSSPVGALYDFQFDSDTLTDGKVLFLLLLFPSHN